ncbi:helicase associated domain-containing protein [Streptomyces sp. NPDC001851]|uniref:helicase associated domain-containing protein n=1 Tax=Streptomyces sp. NPDC001851 TaxID=3154529 RepID=UPI00332F9598
MLFLGGGGHRQGRDGFLDTARAQALERLGIFWDSRQQAFERGLAHAAAYAARNGHLAIPVDFLHDDFSLGRWLATQRTAALTAPDRWWNPPWPLTWQRAYHTARRQTEQNAAVSVAGEWLTTQGRRADDLSPRSAAS